jgi:Rps23 Pro-64 3,4-dihydroxylase Tpa1-like proline 4-hydroxylase
LNIKSDDLRECDGACITGLRDFLVSYMKDWMQDITGIHLTGQVDATCSIYNSTDTLLCHDDELEGRRIAFILYLVRDWMVSDGGTTLLPWQILNGLNSKPLSR